MCSRICTVSLNILINFAVSRSLLIRKVKQSNNVVQNEIN